jgi:hypothetical protein
MQPETPRGQGIKGRMCQLMLSARQVAQVLMMCGVENGECRGQVTQERKPRPMLVVCQITDVREVCEAGRGGRWRAFCWNCRWKGGDDRGDGSGRHWMLDGGDGHAGHAWRRAEQVWRSQGASARGSRECGRVTSASSKWDSMVDLGSQLTVQGSTCSTTSRLLGHTPSIHQAGSESQAPKRAVRTFVN